jgi:hypothetical protein
MLVTSPELTKKITSDPKRSCGRACMVTLTRVAARIASTRYNHTAAHPVLGTSPRALLRRRCQALPTQPPAPSEAYCMRTPCYLRRACAFVVQEDRRCGRERVFGSVFVERRRSERARCCSHGTASVLCQGGAALGYSANPGCTAWTHARMPACDGRWQERL